MKKLKLIKVYVSLIVIFLSFNAYSQYGVIEMKNGEKFEMADTWLVVEGEQLRYSTEKYEAKALVYGIGQKKHKEEFLEKSRAVNISEIEKIHVQGEFLVGNKLISNFIGIKYIKVNRRYQKFYVIKDGECQLLIMPESGNAIFSYYVQKGNEDPFILHKSGTGLGPKYKSRAKKYFADCGPAMDYIKKDLKLSTIPNLIDIYNASCVK
jgi:hypothetical protein